MAASFNSVMIIGNLGQDVEVKSFANGGKIANLRVACSERWKDKNSGEQREKTEWVSVVLQSDGLVNVAERFLRKGSKVFIQGKLATRKWTAQDGSERYATEVVVGGFDGKLVMLDGASSGGKSSHPNAETGWTGQAPSAPSSDNWSNEALSDEIPF